MQLLSNRVKFSSCAAGLILFFFSAAPLFAEDRATTGSAKSLAAAETAFAQESVEKGMRSAFLQCALRRQHRFSARTAERQEGMGIEASIGGSPAMAPRPRSHLNKWRSRLHHRSLDVQEERLRTRNPRISVTSSPSGDGKMGNGNYSSISARIIRGVRPGPARSCSWWKITPLTNRPSPLCRPCWPSIAVTPRTASGIFPRSQRI